MQINFQALTDIISIIDIKNFAKDKTSNRSFFDKFGFAIMSFVALAIIVIGFFLSYSVLGNTASNELLIAIIVFIGMTLVIIVATRFRIIKNIRLNRFAADNNLVYAPVDNIPNEKGMIFNTSGSYQKWDILKNKSENQFEIGNYSYTIQSGEHKKRINCGYVKIYLSRNLPHMVLDSKKNNTNLFGISISNLPVLYNKDQILSLEGDFDSYFTLYAPKDYERDALYVFSPDLMALFIDKIGSYDAEIVDNILYVYSNKTFKILNTNTLKRLFNIINIVGSKAVSQTDRYSDATTALKDGNIVAESGRRLRRGIPLSVIISTIVFLVFCLLYFLQFYIDDITIFFLK